MLIRQTSNLKKFDKDDEFSWLIILRLKKNKIGWVDLSRREEFEDNLEILFILIILSACFFSMTCFLKVKSKS